MPSAGTIESPYRWIVLGVSWALVTGYERWRARSVPTAEAPDAAARVPTQA